MKNDLTGTADQSFQDSNLKSYRYIYHINSNNQIKKWIWALLLLLIIILLLPWTQNIRAKGKITTLFLEQRPQEVNTIIAGKVIKWNVKEGDYVKQGDTLLQLGEIKIDYLDPKLLSRTKEQIEAKQNSIDNYLSKATTADLQIEALQKGRELKLRSIDNKLLQQNLKVSSDSNDLVAAINELTISRRQIEGARVMYDSGSISLADLERRKISYQNALAKRIVVENKLLQSKQEINNLLIEKNSTLQDYVDKISKTAGEKYTSLSNVAGSKGDRSKLENLYANYDARNQLYYILAPQNGQIIKAKKAGIGEMVKEAEMIVTIVPDKVVFAVEMFVDPMDLPLLTKGQKVRLIFDGFPAIVFSGWPKQSSGTFGGVVAAIESEVSSNGKFRVLVKEDGIDKAWPKQLKMGSGANGIALLKDVPIYYELWRNINGFPPEYYKTLMDKSNQDETK